MAKKNLIYLLIILLLVIGCTVVSVKLYLVQKKANWYEKVLSNFYPPLATSLNYLSGRVVEKGADFIVVETTMRVKQFPAPDGSDLVKQRLKVKITDQTQIYHELTSDELAAKGYVLYGPMAEPISLEDYRTNLTLADINVDKDVFVLATDNIRGKTEIIASEIKVY